MAFREDPKSGDCLVCVEALALIMCIYWCSRTWKVFRYFCASMIVGYNLLEMIESETKNGTFLFLFLVAESFPMVIHLLHLRFSQVEMSCNTTSQTEVFKFIYFFHFNLSKAVNFHNAPPKLIRCVNFWATHVESLLPKPILFLKEIQKFSFE